MNCKNCNTQINYKFCPDCGQPTSLKRIDGHYIVHEIEHILHFERGILYTIRELVTNPGQKIRNYLSENRSRLVKPILFIIMTSLIYSLTINLFGSVLKCMLGHRKAQEGANFAECLTFSSNGAAL